MFIEADLHCHSLASTHAYSTIKELAKSACDNGLKLFALTDHAPEMQDAPHIWHFHNLVILPRVINNVTVLRGAEANLKNLDGDIDLSDFDMKDLEWIVVSCHEPVIKPGNMEENTQAYINLMKKNKRFDLIGHPTTYKYPVDFDVLAKACSEYGKFLELNESSVKYNRSSVENCMKMLAACKKHSVPVVVDTDCHYSDLIGQVPTAERIIKEADFPEELIFNRKAENVIKYLVEKKNIVLN